MSARTELRKLTGRKVHLPGHGDFVATLTPEGVSLRKAGKRGTVTLTWAEVAREGLERVGLWLTEREWNDPLRTLGALSRLRRLHGRKRKPRGGDAAQ